MLVTGHLGRREVAEGEAALGGMLAAQFDGLDVGPDDLVVVGAAAAEPFFDEALQVLLGHVDQVGQSADDHHVGGPVVAGGAGQFVDGHSDDPGFARGCKFLEVPVIGVVDDDPAVPDFPAMGLVGFPVECHQDIDIIACAEDGRIGDAGLGPGGSAQDLGGEGGIGEGVVPDLGGNLGQSFGRGNYSLSAFSGEADYEVAHLHQSSSRLVVR